MQLAPQCRHLTGIDPLEESVHKATRLQIPNTTFMVGSAEALPFHNCNFDTAVFTLSLHHVPIPKMEAAIDEAIRVLQPRGRIVFLEPTEYGTFFEAEELFMFGDCDERAEKEAAYTAMKKHLDLTQVTEWIEDTEFEFDSRESFIKILQPTQALDELDDFLIKNQLLLDAQLRVNIFQVA